MLTRGRPGWTVSSSATIDPSAVIDAPAVRIGPHSTIGPGVRIRGDRVQIGDDCHIGAGCRIEGTEIDLGENCVLFPDVTICALTDLRVGAYAKVSRECTVKAGSVDIGIEFWMNRDAEIGGGGWRRGDGSFRCGDRCHVGRRTHINTARPVVFGHDTAVGMDCTLATHAHWQPVTLGYPQGTGSITLGDDVAIYTRSVLSPGVRVGNGAAIGAGSVVTADVPEGAFVAGAPARVLRPARSPVDLPAVVAEILAGFDPGPEDPGRVSAMGADLVVADGQGVSECVFALDRRVVTGRAGPLSESLRQHLFGFGLRFGYDGYLRSHQHPDALVAAGIEE